MKKQITAFFICFLITFILFPITAKADIGPKPSVIITFENMGDEICYGTLLSRSASTGPASVWEPAPTWDGDESKLFTYGLDLDIWKAFVNYQDSDGYYFLQLAWQCNEAKQFSWGYYPPDPFKILLYYPETDTFLVSGIYEQYAFDSYFTVDMNDLEPVSAASQGIVLIAEKSYDYTWEIISLVCRIVITILLETGIAFLFGFRQKQLLILITCINIVTQVLLNVKLNIINYNLGFLSFVFFYICYEMLVFIIEAILYCILFNRVGNMSVPKWKTALYTPIPKWKIILYALTANVISFIGGFLIAIWVPGIF